ncbi:hypothetical protein LUZ60_006051 [Juncus effusus]|nr:hypothetical protein LUZ60_006051 [Juncus effusus]
MATSSSSYALLTLPLRSTSTVRSTPPPPSAVRSIPSANLKASVSRRSDSVLFTPDGFPSKFNREGNECFEEDEEEEEEEEEEDGSLDLLVKFLQNVFKKVSKRARRGVRAVLPPSISTKLVKFSVNGVLILAFLWILKGLLEVVCTFGSMVFLSILLVRGIWSGITYIKENQYYYINRIDNDDYSRWNNAQPVS